MLGPIMDMRVSGTLTVRLAPFSKEDVSALIKNGGMQRRTTTRYMGMNFSPTLETEQEWYDKIRTDAGYMVWGIWDASGDAPKYMGEKVLEWARLAPLDPRVPESLYIVWRANGWTKYGCGSNEELQAQIGTVLKKKYAENGANAAVSDELERLKKEMGL